jgi:hypothetical protein
LLIPFKLGAPFGKNEKFILLALTGHVIPFIQIFQSEVQYHAKFNRCAKFHENQTSFMIIILTNKSKSWP